MEQPLPIPQTRALAISPFALDNETIQFDLFLSLTQTQAGLEGWLVYATELFDAEAIARMAGHFETLLKGILKAPDQRLSQLPLLTDEEREKVLVSWNNTGAIFPQRECLQDRKSVV